MRVPGLTSQEFWDSTPREILHLFDEAEKLRKEQAYMQALAPWATFAVSTPKGKRPPKVDAFIPKRVEHTVKSTEELIDQAALIVTLLGGKDKRKHK